ncbi:MAG: type I DNA topoisomerase, partial [Planctomycetaceae bacterium]
RLYGYTLSPLLWKKIARGLSAGRVQSVAVKILVLRELERLAFRSADYWDLKAELQVTDRGSFSAQLITSAGKRVASGRDFDENTGKLKPEADVVLLDSAAANSLKEKLTQGTWKVASIKQRSEARKPYPPFTTSTLQQEGNRKLGMTARQTMQVAQRLYEDGYITYMRTDSVYLSKEAIDSARTCVHQRFGDAYLHASVRQFTNRNQNAQEAHEAIRPAGTEMKTGEELGLSGRQLNLYSLIWKRTVSTQMAEARLQFRTVLVEVDDCEFRATGRTVEFPGFFRAYVEGVDDPQAALDDQESSLPPMEENDSLNCQELQSLEHRTSPPARFTEATLVRELEREGVGRPSTYASIIGTIQDRGYVRKSGSQLVPTFTALAVTKLLQDYFPQLVDIKFTADMEKTLDDIATGTEDRLPYLDKFYRGADGLDEQVKKNEDTIDPRQACTLKLDGFDSDIRVGRWGPYFEKVADGEKLTASIPDDIAPADITNDVAEQLILEKQKGPRPIGMHPEEGLPIYVINGPFGPYVQLGDVTEEQPKPKRVSLTKHLTPDDLTLDTAIQLLELPKRLGHHPETGKVVNVGIGRFGPYVLHDKTYGNFDRKTHLYTYEDRVFDALSINLEVAVDMLKHARKRSAPTPIKELGPHPDDGEVVAVFEGRYGPYVKHNKVNATIPKDHEIEHLTLDDALPWLADKAAKTSSGRSTKKKTTKKKTTKKKTAKKKTAKKKTAKKKTPATQPEKKADD